MIVRYALKQGKKFGKNAVNKVLRGIMLKIVQIVISVVLSGTHTNRPGSHIDCPVCSSI